MNHSSNSRSAGTILIGLGLLFLFFRFTGISFSSLMWPFWVLVPGALMLYAAFRGETADEKLAVPGAIVGGTGAILFTLNLTGHWEAWAYAWALYPAFVGLALQYAGERNGDEKLIKSGEASARSGMVMLVGFGLFFELVVFGALDGPLLPLLLIFGGLYLMFGRHVKLNPGALRSSKPKREPKDPETGIDPDLRRKMDKAMTDSPENDAA